MNRRLGRWVIAIIVMMAVCMVWHGDKPIGCSTNAIIVDGRDFNRIITTIEKECGIPIKSISFATGMEINQPADYIITKDCNGEILLFGRLDKSGHLLVGTKTDSLLVLDGAFMFANLKNLLEIDFSNIDFSRNVSMREMFYKCRAMEKVDINKINTSKVEIMFCTFGYCTSLNHLNLNGLNLENVFTLEALCLGCSSLENASFTNLSTKSLFRTDGMFKGCSSLNTVDLSGLDMRRVKWAMSMFAGCSSITDLDLSNLSLPSLEWISNMFSGCDSLEHLNLSSFDTRRVKYMNSLFEGSFQNGCEIIVGDTFVVNDSTHTDNMFKNTGIVSVIGDNQHKIREKLNLLKKEADTLPENEDEEFIF